VTKKVKLPIKKTPLKNLYCRNKGEKEEEAKPFIKTELITTLLPFFARI
jgi:hypothetical protein